MTAPTTLQNASSPLAPPLKQRVYLALEDPLAARPLGKALGLALIVLIVLNALLVGVPDTWMAGQASAALFVFSVFSTIVFGLEYCARVWIADLVYPDRTPGRARARYIFSLMGIIDLLAFVPALILYFVPASSAVNDAIRIIRLVRLIKISRYMRGLRSIARVMTKHHREIVAAFMVLALLAIASSVLMFEAEHTAQPETFDSILTGLYWAMTTMTSTGYGDIVPVTPLGRLIGFVTMVLSIGVVAIPAGIFSAGFVEEFRAQRADDANDLPDLVDVLSDGHDQLEAPQNAERAPAKDSQDTSCERAVRFEEGQRDG